MKRENAFRSQGGFTLIEAMIAMTVLVIGILSLYTMQLASIRGNATANRISVESAWAQNQIEAILLKKLKDIPDIFTDTSRYSPHLSGSPRLSRENYSDKKITLLDRNNDGSGLLQDPDNNGVDDSNVDGVPNFGLDAVTKATADFWEDSPDGKYTILYNFAIDIPFPKTVTIRILVQQVSMPNAPPAVFTYYKDDTI